MRAARADRPVKHLLRREAVDVDVRQFLLDGARQLDVVVALHLRRQARLDADLRRAHFPCLASAADDLCLRKVVPLLLAVRAAEGAEGAVLDADVREVDVAIDDVASRHRPQSAAAGRPLPARSRSCSPNPRRRSSVTASSTEMSSPPERRSSTCATAGSMSPRSRSMRPQPRGPVLPFCDHDGPPCLGGESGRMLRSSYECLRTSGRSCFVGGCLEPPAALSRAHHARLLLRPSSSAIS